MKNQTVTAAEATALLGYKARSSLTRLVQAGKITPVFKASGQLFNRADVLALIPPTTPVPDVPSPQGRGAGVPHSSPAARDRAIPNSGSLQGDNLDDSQVWPDIHEGER